MHKKCIENFLLCSWNEVFQFAAFVDHIECTRFASRLQSNHNAFSIFNRLFGQFHCMVHLRCDAQILEEALMSRPKLSPYRIRLLAKQIAALHKIILCLGPLQKQRRNGHVFALKVIESTLTRATQSLNISSNSLENGTSSTLNVASLKLSWRAMYIPRNFMSMATSSIALTPLLNGKSNSMHLVFKFPVKIQLNWTCFQSETLGMTHRFSTVCKNSGKLRNGVPCPHRPNRTMYAIFRGSEAPTKRTNQNEFDWLKSVIEWWKNGVTGGRSVNNSCWWQLLLQFQHFLASYGGFLTAHRYQMFGLVTLIENDDTVKFITVTPFNQLLQSCVDPSVCTFRRWSAYQRRICAKYNTILNRTIDFRADSFVFQLKWIENLINLLMINLKGLRLLGWIWSHFEMSKPNVTFEQWNSQLRIEPRDKSISMEMNE